MNDWWESQTGAVQRNAAAYRRGLPSRIQSRERCRLIRIQVGRKRVIVASCAALEERVSRRLGTCSLPRRH